MKNQRLNFSKLPIIVFGLAIALLFLAVASPAGSVPDVPRPGIEDHVITLEQAVKLIENFKNAPSTPTIKGGSFARNIFDRILSQPGCAGLRYYYAKKDDGTATLVLVGVDTGGNDIVQGVLGDDNLPCPPYCGAPNQLNR